MAVKRALISVSDKTGVVEFAKGLHELGVEIISTGGTMKAIAAAGIPVKSVSEVTGFPEMMDGRVKTLHPKIHGGILAIRDNPEHVKAMKEHGIKGIDLVAVNLYPFRETIAKPNVTRAEAIENIDIGGPSMVRAAAKNYKYVTIVVDPSQYGEILERIKNDTLDEDFRLKLSRKAFLHTGLYDWTEIKTVCLMYTAKPSSSSRISVTARTRIRKLHSIRTRKPKVALLQLNSFMGRNCPTTTLWTWKQPGTWYANGAKTSQPALLLNILIPAAQLLAKMHWMLSSVPSTQTANLHSAAL